jgi:hypothetical protein
LCMNKMKSSIGAVMVAKNRLPTASETVPSLEKCRKMCEGCSLVLECISSDPNGLSVQINAISSCLDVG